MTPESLHALNRLRERILLAESLRKQGDHAGAAAVDPSHEERAQCIEILHTLCKTGDDDA